MNAALIINVESGRDALPRLRGHDPETFRQAFTEAGFKGPVSFVRGDGVEAMMERRASEGHDRVIVGGGDGTISTAAATAVRQGITLGVLPLGTCNHFARDLGVPRGWKEAMTWLQEATKGRVDLGEVNGHVFINNVSVGLYPRMVRKRNKERLSQRWGRRLGSALALIKTLWRFRLLDLQMEYADTVLDFRTPFLFVGNNTYSGDLLAHANRSSLTGGHLWACTASVRGPMGLWRVAWRALRAKPERIEKLNTVKAGELVVRMGEGERLVAIDGEVLSLESPLRFRSKQGALKILVRSAESHASGSDLRTSPSLAPRLP